MNNLAETFKKAKRGRMSKYDPTPDRVKETLSKVDEATRELVDVAREGNEVSEDIKSQIKRQTEMVDRVHSEVSGVVSMIERDAGVLESIRGGQKEIVARVSDVEKKEMPDTVRVSNLAEIVVPQPVDTVSVNRPKWLDVVISKIIFPVEKILEVLRVGVAIANRDPSDGIPVRLVDAKGSRFIDPETKQTVVVGGGGGGGSSYQTADGRYDKGLIDAQRHVQVDVLTMPDGAATSAKQDEVIAKFPFEDYQYMGTDTTSSDTYKYVAFARYSGVGFYCMRIHLTDSKDVAFYYDLDGSAADFVSFWADPSDEAFTYINPMSA